MEQKILGYEIAYWGTIFVFGDFWMFFTFFVYFWRCFTFFFVYFARFYTFFCIFLEVVLLGYEIAYWGTFFVFGHFCSVFYWDVRFLLGYVFFFFLKKYI